jgi:UDP-N-acetylglucosamine:LPS N-acetylglucosamine transferase
MKIAIVAGGTGGHIYPGMAIGEEIKRRLPAAEILFIGSQIWVGVPPRIFISEVALGFSRLSLAKLGQTLKTKKTLAKANEKAIKERFIQIFMASCLVAEKKIINTEHR